MNKTITIIGSGLAGMSSAAYLAKQGHRVRILEKNSTYGGRLQTFSEKGYTFDSGPSWYWMPDLFDSFFSDFDKKTSDYYSLKRLDPGYRIFFNKDEHFDVVEDYEKLKKELNQIESGAAESLDKFLNDAHIALNTITGTDRLNYILDILNRIKTLLTDGQIKALGPKLSELIEADGIVMTSEMEIAKLIEDSLNISIVVDENI